MKIFALDRKPPVQGEKPVEEKSEAILLIEKKKKEAEEDEQERIRQVEETLRQQREKEDEELKILKEKQVWTRASMRLRWAALFISSIFVGPKKERARDGRCQV